MSSILGDAVGAVSPVTDVVKIVAGFVTLLASPTGQKLLDQFFVDHGISADKLSLVIASAGVAEDPKS